MLVLTRKPHEEIKISDDVVLTVLSTGDGKVRIGVTAPRKTSVRLVKGELSGAEDVTPLDMDRIHQD